VGEIEKGAKAGTGQVPSATARRKQTAIDVSAALILTMLVWPFPLARASFAPLVHVVSILLLWQIVVAGYYAVSCGFWRKTAGMHLLGLKLADPCGVPPTAGVAVAWGLVAGLLAMPRLLSGGPSDTRPDAAERLSGATVVVAD
jgi:uncharacterized RDD family membrane protein YckC